MVDPTNTELTREMVAAQRRRERRRDEIKGSILRRIMSSEMGREFVDSLLEDTGASCQPYVYGGAESERETIFRCGEKNYGIRLLDRIHSTCPELWLVMQRERIARLELERQEDKEQQ